MPLLTVIMCHVSFSCMQHTHTHTNVIRDCRAIILGVLMRACGLASPKGVVSGEYFIKIGIVLMVMNFSSIASVGVRGLVSCISTPRLLCTHFAWHNLSAYWLCLSVFGHVMLFSLFLCPCL